MDHEARSALKIAYSIKEASEVTSLGRTRIYELINEGKLDRRRVGRRSLITAESLHALLAEGDEQ